MSSKVKEEYPVVIESINMDGSERARLNRLVSINARLKSTLIDMLIEAHTKIADRENEMWDELAKRFGYKGIDQLLDEDKNLQISWASSTITLRSKKEESKT
jgi:hypothetical protein